MTIAINFLLAVVVFAGVVGLLAYNILATRTPAQAKLRPVTNRRPPVSAPTARWTAPASKRSSPRQVPRQRRGPGRVPVA